MDCLNIRNTFFLVLYTAFNICMSIDPQGPLCPVFKVLRGIVHKICINKPLKISCSLKYCDDKLINITWTKSEDSDFSEDWIPVTETDQISLSQEHFDLKNVTSYLSFTNILKHHEGLYRCELTLPHVSTVSHYINVSVSDDMNGTEISCTKTTETRDIDSDLWWLPYLFICLGVLILVFIVMLISVLCVSGLKCVRQRRIQRAKVQQTLQHNHGLLTQPSQQSTLHESDGGDDSLSNTTDPTSSQVVYASLNHFIPTPSSTTSCRTAVEFSEYASIRVS